MLVGGGYTLIYWALSRPSWWHALEDSGSSLVNHRTPLEERWGGWYVTGVHGAQRHRGNLFGKEAFARQEQEPNYCGNLTDLKPFFEVTKVLY